MLMNCNYNAAYTTGICRDLTACWVTYSVAFEQDIQVFCGFTVLVVIEGTLVNGVFTIRLWTITAIEAFLPQSLCNIRRIVQND